MPSKTIVEWFNPANELHLASFQSYNLNGDWPEGFLLPGLVDFSQNWVEEIFAKIGRYHIKHHSGVSGHNAMKTVLQKYTCKMDDCYVICEHNEFFCNSHGVCPACGASITSDLLKGLACSRCGREFEDGDDYIKRVQTYWEAIQQREETEIENVVEESLGRLNLTTWLNLQDDDHRQIFREFIGTGQLPEPIHDDSTKAWVAERVKELSEIEGTFFMTGTGDGSG